MLKLYTFMFSLSIMSFTTINCMITEFKYKPCIQEFDIIIKSTRKSLGQICPKDIPFIQKSNLPSIEHCLIKNSNITIIREATKREQKGRCFDYALTQITDKQSIINIYENVKLAIQTSTINIEKFFEQTDNPQKQDLVIYTPDENDRRTKHFAVFINQNCFESKWGTNKEIIQHQPWDIPDYYGNSISFWTLKKKFTTLDGKKILKKEIKKDINKFMRQRMFIVPVTQILILGTGLGMLITSLIMPK